MTTASLKAIMTGCMENYLQVWALKVNGCHARIQKILSWLYHFFIQVVFEAAVGATYNSDIAIDDVSLKDGSCV